MKKTTWQIDTTEMTSHSYFILAESKEEALTKWKDSPPADDGTTVELVDGVEEVAGKDNQ